MLRIVSSLPVACGAKTNQAELGVGLRRAHAAAVLVVLHSGTNSHAGSRSVSEQQPAKGRARAWHDSTCTSECRLGLQW